MKVGTLYAYKINRYKSLILLSLHFRKQKTLYVQTIRYGIYPGNRLLRPHAYIFFYIRKIVSPNIWAWHSMTHNIN